MDLVTLCMIVKDEAHGIERTLESAKSAIDSWTICDTGSTDGTPDIIRRVMAGIPGKLHEIPFIDFATTRNAALDLVDDDYSIMLSGDELLVGGERIREQLNGDRGGYFIKVALGGTDYLSARVLRTKDRWRYSGVTHEAVDIHPSLPGKLHDCHILHFGGARPGRWELDIELLSKTAPTSDRDQFYLAQSYECLERWPEALQAYKERVERGGWREEVYESLFRIARISEKNLPWQWAQQCYLDAYAYAPHRAEPLRALARHYANSPTAAIFAAAADALPYPEHDLLFVDRSAYRGL